MAQEDSVKSGDEHADLKKLNENIERIEGLSQRLRAALARKKPIPTALQGPSQELYMKAASAYMSEMINNPAKIVDHQIGYWGKTLKHYVEAQQRLAKGDLTPPPDETPKDRRFSNPLWDTNPYFNFLKQQYLTTAGAVEAAVDDLDMEERERKRMEYFTRQIIDMLAPTNFLATNPEALERAVATEGESLVMGLENLVRDLEDHDGEMIVNLADKTAFEVGKNIGTSKGRWCIATACSS